MNLDRADLRVLLAVQETMTLQELADDLEISGSYASTLTSDLAERGLLDKHRDGKAVTVKPSDGKALELLHRLDGERGHIDWKELLGGKAVEMLFYLDEARTASELADVSGNYRNTVYRILNRFTERGIITKTGTQYTVPEDFSGLVEFAREYVHHVHRNRVREVSPRAMIVWEGVGTFLIRTDDTINAPAYHPTGPGQFEDFGLPLLTTEANHYFHTEEDWRLDPVSLVCHTLLIDDGPRYRSYCLLLLANEEPDRDELDVARRYGLRETVEELVAYLDSEGEETTAAMPSWDELDELADEYGVTL